MNRFIDHMIQAAIFRDVVKKQAGVYIITLPFAKHL